MASNAPVSILVAMAAVLITASALAEDPVIDVRDSDPVMNAAIAEARATLPFFWERFAAPAAGETEFSLKLKISDANGDEHFWCVDIEGDAQASTCIIGNEPQIVRKVSYGERVTVDPAIISDWMYLVGDHIRGARTLRALLPHMSKEEADFYEAILIDE